MAKYIDGFVLVVPKGKEAEYQKMAEISFIVFESKEHRDEVNKKVMAEMDKVYTDQVGFEMPADMQRMAYGGFQVVVEG